MERKSQFVIGVDRVGGEATVSIGGELDLDGAPRLRECLVQLADGPEPPKRIVVDLAELDFIDSTGIGVLIAALRRLQQQGGDMVLRAPKRRIQAVLELTGLTTQFEIEPDLDGGPDGWANQL